MNFCKDCKHFSGDWRCKQPDAPPHYITGKPERRSCLDVRLASESFEHCNLFVQKDKWWKWFWRW